MAVFVIGKERKQKGPFMDSTVAGGLAAAWNHANASLMLGNTNFEVRRGVGTTAHPEARADRLAYLSLLPFALVVRHGRSVVAAFSLALDDVAVDGDGGLAHGARVEVTNALVAGGCRLLRGSRRGHRCTAGHRVVRAHSGNRVVTLESSSFMFSFDSFSSSSLSFFCSSTSSAVVKNCGDHRRNLWVIYTGAASVKFDSDSLFFRGISISISISPCASVVSVPIRPKHEAKKQRRQMVMPKQHQHTTVGSVQLPKAQPITQKVQPITAHTI